MQQNTKRLISMIIALAFLVIALVVFFDYVEPAYGSVEQLKANVLANSQFLSSENTIVTQAKTLISEYQQESQGSQSLDVAMPSGEDLAGAVAQVYGLAQANGISVQAIGITSPAVTAAPTTSGTSAPTAAQLVKPLGTLILQITASGSYEDFQMFLSNLETNIRLFDVKSISIQSAGQAGKAPQDFYTYNLAATTYYQLP